MVQSAGFDPSIIAFSSAEQRRPPERQPDSARITPTTEPESTSADSRRRLESADTPPRPTRIAFTAKFGPDSDGFPLQLVSGDELRGADANDPQVIVENRVSQDDSRTALLQAQETRDAATDETRRQQEAATAARREDNRTDSARVDTDRPEPDESRQTSGSVLDLEV